MRESCSWCDASAVEKRHLARIAIVKEAMKQSYQLYQKQWMSKEYVPVDYNYILKGTS